MHERDSLTKPTGVSDSPTHWAGYGDSTLKEEKIKWDPWPLCSCEFSGSALLCFSGVLRQGMGTIYSPFSLWLLPLLVGLGSSQPPQFSRTQSNAEGCSCFSRKVHVKMHMQKASTSLTPTLHPLRGRTTRFPFLRLWGGAHEGVVGRVVWGWQICPCSLRLQKAVPWLPAYANLTSDQG